MIGSLIKYSVKKRMTYFPSQSPYAMFDGHIGLVISYTKKDTGDEHVRVKWVKPIKYHGNLATVSDFNLLNFEVVSEAG